ncbi:MAG: hypothetical protein GJU76_15455 [Gallionella sp.]|jgi:cell wall-associated NlpC family hydrolase|nr:hypothetical protein [Gallionella sp.]
MKFILLLALVTLTACSSPAPRPSVAGASASSDSAVSHLTDYAQSLVGVPYRYGGNDPDSGFDCSGFVSHVYHHTLGIELPRSSIGMSHLGQSLDHNELRPGDLVFFNTLHRKFSHVGIYLGDNHFIHAPSSGGSVRIDDLGNHYWRRNYNGARRINE